MVSLNWEDEVANVGKLLEYVRGNPGDLRKTVGDYYLQLASSHNVHCSREVEVIVNTGTELGKVDCALASPASAAVVFAEDKEQAMLGLWKLTEFAPNIAVLILSSSDPSLIDSMRSIIWKSALMRNVSRKFILIDIETGRRDIINKTSEIRHHIQQHRGGRSKRILGFRNEHKVQD
ncbi:MAG: hypothetical protein NT157_05715 [Candidatus Micrarchaeota archaeon]|nr:hypothetical protein [Candidatus Micrarchaeota archaeon]